MLQHSMYTEQVGGVGGWSLFFIQKHRRPFRSDENTIRYHARKTKEQINKKSNNKTIISRYEMNVYEKKIVWIGKLKG